MNFAGLQKTTLIDYPGKIAATVFTYGCNFRCPFCHNPELVSTPQYKNVGYTDSEILNFLKKRTGKLDGLVISGGEPLIHEDLPDFILKVKSLGFLAKVDTNGSFPEMIKKLIELKCVDYWAMDIKNCEARYFETIGGTFEIDKIRQSIDLIMKFAKDYEFRTTVVPGLHNEDSVRGIGKLIKGARKHYIQNFHASKTVDSKFSKMKGFSEVKLNLFQKIMHDYVKKVEVRE